MKSHHWVALIFFGLFTEGINAAKTPDNPSLSALKVCSQEPAPLLRLDCYDKALMTEQSVQTSSVQSGMVWKRAINHEKKRDDHSTAFLLTDSGGDNPQVILTAPAIGTPPPRPVLMLSCIDNITRLQVALITPLSNDDGSLVLVTEKTRFSANWFVRENGFLLESSRGLAGIDEIKKLFDAQNLTLTLPGSSLRLIFTITDLAQEIKPLRQACHW